MKNLVFVFLMISIISCKSQKKENIKSNNLSNINATVIDNAVLAGGKLIRIDSFPSKYIQPRPVDVWLPENYLDNKKYAVLYMHDGQMLFDATKTWNKQEWMIDEVATKLMREGVTKDFIVVAIHNISQINY